MGRGVMGDTPAKPGDKPNDEDLLKKRLAAVVNISNERATTGFRRRRSSGLLFQVRRRIRRDGAPTASIEPQPPAI
jgi:hypothetical protein